MGYKIPHAIFNLNMEKNKKGMAFSIAGIIGILIFIVILAVAVIPIYTSAVDSAKTYSCDDDVLDTLNVSANLCYNGTHMSETESPTRTGTTAGQEVLLLLGVTFLVIGGLVFVGKKSGVIS